jgi:4-hydroxythreonine-4-phosphate dehydrogenase
VTARAPLALTMGDPAGIGLEIAAAAWVRRSSDAAPFCLVGDAARMRARLAQLGADLPLAAVRYEESARAFATALPVLADFPVGLDDPAATVRAIELAVEAVRVGRARAVVTNPISKERLYAAGFRHPGHTEFLGELARSGWGEARDPVMMLWSPTLATVPTTIHIALDAVKAALTPALLTETLLTVDADMKARFGLERPRIAVAGLNPHAGEGGAMGREEIEVIIPVLDALRSRGLDLIGPLPADTMFHERARARYDVAVCMYHDQALIPLKTLAFDDGVNVTLGLPFVRTSPDHGTAFDIAGKGVARPDSLIAALALADRLTR